MPHRNQGPPHPENWRLVSVLARLEEALLTVLLLVMIVLACYQIALRWFTSGGLLWIDPLLRHLVLWGGLLGAVLATAKDNHISMDILSYLVGDRAKRWLKLAINLFSTIVCVFLFRATILFIKSEIAYGGSSLFGWASWVWNLIFPIAFALICLHFLIGAIASFRATFSPDRNGRTDA